jgi:hypothetical protein
MADLRPLHEWTGAPAQLVMWVPTPAAMAAAREADVSPVPPSYEQEQHLWSYRTSERRREEMARLVIVTWEVTGRCDVRAMTHVINAHLRNHDTYHTRFEETDGRIVRRVLADPASLQVAATPMGTVTAETWRQHVAATPGPFDWDCFRFGILQRASGFTFFACIDHVHADATVVAFLLEDIHNRYRAIQDGDAPPRQPPPGRYLDYCRTQRARTASLTLSDAPVADWIDFLRGNGGRMPPFPLPLGELDDRSLAEHVRVDILDPAEATQFEAACRASGARFVGGLFACAALTEHALCGSRRYSVVTPATPRRTAEESSTSGWCMGVVPIDFDVDTSSFPETARRAQRCFDERLHLCTVPIERVLELAAPLPDIRPVATGGVMVSYIDANLPPLGAHVARDWHALKGRVYINPGLIAQVGLWFFRTQAGLSLTAAYPANDTARASMERYLDSLRRACRRVAASDSLVACQ